MFQQQQQPPPHNQQQMPPQGPQQMQQRKDFQSADTQAKEKLSHFVYEYLVHMGAKNTAEMFRNELLVAQNSTGQNIQPMQIDLSQPPGFLFNWFSVFWDLYSAHPDKKDKAEPSQEAKAYHKMMFPVYGAGGGVPEGMVNGGGMYGGGGPACFPPNPQLVPMGAGLPPQNLPDGMFPGVGYFNGPRAVGPPHQPGPSQSNQASPIPGGPRYVQQGTRSGAPTPSSVIGPGGNNFQPGGHPTPQIIALNSEQMRMAMQQRQQQMQQQQQGGRLQMSMPPGAGGRPPIRPQQPQFGNHHYMDSPSGTPPFHHNQMMATAAAAAAAHNGGTLMSPGTTGGGPLGMGGPDGGGPPDPVAAQRFIMMQQQQQQFMNHHQQQQQQQHQEGASTGTPNGGGAAGPSSVSGGGGGAGGPETGADGAGSTSSQLHSLLNGNQDQLEMKHSPASFQPGGPSGSNNNINNNINGGTPGAGPGSVHSQQSGGGGSSSGANPTGPGPQGGGQQQQQQQLLASGQMQPPISEASMEYHHRDEILKIKANLMEDFQTNFSSQQ